MADSERVDSGYLAYAVSSTGHELTTGDLNAANKSFSGSALGGSEIRESRQIDSPTRSDTAQYDTAEYISGSIAATGGHRFLTVNPVSNPESRQSNHVRNG